MSQYDLLKRLFTLKHCDSTVADWEDFVRDMTQLVERIDYLELERADLREAMQSMRLQYDNLYRKEMQRMKRRERSQLKVGAV